MKTFLDAATVTTGDGKWMSGTESDHLDCGREYAVSGNICQSATPPDPSEYGGLYNVRPFVVESKQKFPVRCAPEDAEAALRTDMADSTEYFVARNFWLGDATDWDGATEGLFLADADIATVAVSATFEASIGAALAAAYANHPGISPILHLGLTAALSLAPNYFTDNTKMQVAVSPGYPPNGIAVTGPVSVSLGDIEARRLIDQSVNREHVYGSRFAAFDFDPCLAVVVA